MRTRSGIQRARRLRRLARRTLYSLVPLAVLLAGAETVLRLVGYEGQPDREVSWCREQAFDAPPFLTAMALDRVPKTYVATPLPAQPRPYPAVKQPHERRVFVLGGSAAHGYGFSRNGSFAGRLEAAITPMLITWRSRPGKFSPASPSSRPAKLPFREKP